MDGCVVICYFLLLIVKHSSLLFALWDKHVMQVRTYFYLRRKVALFVSGIESLHNRVCSKTDRYSTVRFTIWCVFHVLGHLKSDIKSYSSAWFRSLKILDLLLHGLMLFFCVHGVVVLWWLSLMACSCKPLSNISVSPTISVLGLKFPHCWPV